MKRIFTEVLAVALVFGLFVGLFTYIGVSRALIYAPRSGGFTTESTTKVATSSTIQVGPQQVVTLFEANSSCANRLVGVLKDNTTVILSFQIETTGATSSANPTPSAARGFPISATTTTQLPASSYGCGKVTAFAAASTTITREEMLR